MKNTLVYYDPELTVTIEDIPIPTYGPDEVLIKVVCAGSNPKDYKHPHPKRFNVKVNQGDDVGGTVEAVGAHIRNFRPGDRVAAFHPMDLPRGTYAEYTVCPANTVFHIPDDVSFEEAATIPLAAYTAAIGVYLNLELPLPWERRDARAPRGGRKTPLVVNGAASAVGAFAVKFAKMRPDVYPIVGTASPGVSAQYARSIGCDVVVDYRGSVEQVTEELKKALGGAELRHVFDASNSLKSVRYASACFAPPRSGEGLANRYTGTLPFTANPMWKDVYPDTAKIEETLQQVGCWYEQIWVGCVHEDKIEGAKMFGGIASKIMEMGLAEGTFSGQPYELIPNGLEGVYGGLVKLRDRKGGNSKLVYRIADTPGL
ncbi:GroES-like protein [Viridothelium virens]|uniref:GroES-like protein n=1 Tax=Viridothelium virens TaxID=1048519 RepID=A0A6A6HD03_VIRVR|nr:GroES-like protein [Viridothelium virens]